MQEPNDSDLKACATQKNTDQPAPRDYLSAFLKTLYSSPIEIIKGLTDKGQFQYLTKLKGTSRGDLLAYNTISFTEIKINILSENT